MAMDHRGAYTSSNLSAKCISYSDFINIYFPFLREAFELDDRLQNVNNVRKIELNTRTRWKFFSKKLSL